MLEGVRRASAFETVGVTRPSSEVCFSERDDGTHVYRISRSLEPCLTFCERTTVDVFEGTADGEVRIVLRWDSASNEPSPPEASVPECGGFIFAGEPTPPVGGR